MWNWLVYMVKNHMNVNHKKAITFFDAKFLTMERILINKSGSSSDAKVNICLLTCVCNTYMFSL
jgi:hypothetical protein